jgi:hypothetical protein
MAEEVPLGLHERPEHAVEDLKGLSISFCTLALRNRMPLAYRAWASVEVALLACRPTT